MILDGDAARFGPPGLLSRLNLVAAMTGDAIGMPAQQSQAGRLPAPINVQVDNLDRY